jgi:hypothetical protein
MLGNSNIFAFVIRTAPNNKLFVWDDKHEQILAEFTFMQKVQDVKLTSELIIVILIDEIHAYKFADLTFIKKWSYASEHTRFIDFRSSRDRQCSILAFYDTESAWRAPSENMELNNEDIKEESK